MMRTGQAPCIHHRLKRVDPDSCGSGSLCSGRASPSPNASKDQSGGSSAEQIGLANRILLSMSSSLCRHATCLLYPADVVSMVLVSSVSTKPRHQPSWPAGDAVHT